MTSLHRHIGLVGLALFGLGDILGAGIYGLVGRAAGEMGHGVWLAFLVSAVVALLTALTYASLGARHPQAAGAPYILGLAFGSAPLSYMIGLAVAASGLTSMATAAKIFSGYFSGAVPSVSPGVVVLFLIIAMGLLVFWGIRESIAVNSVCTVIEVTGLALVIVAGFSFVGTADLTDFSTATNPSGEISLGLVLSGAVLTFYSFVGFEDILNVSEEVKDPGRNVPRGILLALGGATLIYLLVSVIAVSVVPPAQLAKSREPLVDVVRTAWPWFPANIFRVIAMTAVLNTILLNFIMASRLLFGLSRQGLLYRPLAHLHATRRTPHRAIALVVALWGALALLADITQLARATSVLLLLSFALMNAALIRMHRPQVQHAHLFLAPKWVPWAGLITCVALLLSSRSSEWQVAGAFLIVVALTYVLRKPSARAIARFFSTSSPIENPGENRKN